MNDGQAAARNNDYTAQDIQVLGGLEAVRRRPGMYIGSTDQRGLQHLVYEIVYNSVDEAMAGCCDKITVTLMNDNYMKVEDNGSGIAPDVLPASIVAYEGTLNCAIIVPWRMEGTDWHGTPLLATLHVLRPKLSGASNDGINRGKMTKENS